MNIKQMLFNEGLNPYAIVLLVESFLKAPMADHLVILGQPLKIFFPANQTNIGCEKWLGVEITLMPIKADQPDPSTASTDIPPTATSQAVDPLAR